MYPQNLNQQHGCQKWALLLLFLGKAPISGSHIHLLLCAIPMSNTMSANITDESLLNNLRDLSVDLPTVSSYFQMNNLVVVSARKVHI